MPDIHTVDLLVKGHIDERLREAEQRRLVCLARRGGAQGATRPAAARHFGWVRQLAMSIFNVGG